MSSGPRNPRTKASAPVCRLAASERKPMLSLAAVVDLLRQRHELLAKIRGSLKRRPR